MDQRVNIQIGPKGGLMSTAMYLAIGLLVYLWLGTYAVFGWVDPWLYVYMVFWPFILIWNVFLWILLCAAIVGVMLLFAWWWDNR